MNSIAIITARGGSKRIPKKNIKNFCGKPIIAYSIETALESRLFDEVMVSTDDDEIAAVARTFKAMIPFMRSAATSDDYATTADVLLEVMDEYKKRGRQFDTFCCLYPTAPFVTKEMLTESWNKIIQGAPSVVPVTDFDYPPQRGFLISDDGQVSYAYPEYRFTRSQDLPRIVHDCGSFFFSKTAIFNANRTAVVTGCQALLINPLYVQDIDTLQDWDLAELKFEKLARR